MTEDRPKSEGNMTPEEEAALERQIAAQEAGDAEAAKEAAAETEGYPPPIEEAQYPKDEQPQPDLNPSAMLLEGFDVKMFRLPNGEWIVGQFRLMQDQDGNEALAFYKIHRFAAGPHPQTGQPVVNLTPWPVERGTLELSEITAAGDVNSGLFGVNVGNVYLQFISPIQQANMQQAAAAGRQANNRKARAKRIMNAGGKF